MASALKNLSDYKKTELILKEDTEIGIVVSEWNEEVTNALANGALKTLQENGVKAENIRIKHVPGTFELALGAQYMLEYTDVEAVLCLGCVIQGETRHFDFICDAAANAIAKVGLDYHVPVIFGVLTTDNQQQALDRAGGKHGNKGDEAAITALKMISLENTLFTEDLVDISEN
ncbi:MAG: 6,7-dimethyl-8-ribityllumazine synthase [Bacteroidetes bacterium]|nr:MAG: 6,7-dimethyl-8-ribityllumazine synthase [Bacteroidota bacterium]